LRLLFSASAITHTRLIFVAGACELVSAAEHVEAKFSQELK